jgi:hypothetical protein
VGAWIAACGGTTVVDPGTGGSATTSSGTGGDGGSGTGSATGTGGGSSCDGPGQCTLTYPGCCPTCGTPAPDDLVAVALDELDAFHQAQCPSPEPCPDCISCTNGEIFAYCDAGSCQGGHVDDFDLRSCTDDGDCRLRWGADCYEPCGGIAECDGLTAMNVNAGSTLADLVCDPDAPPPPPCQPTYPDNAVALCNAGTCEVTFVDF